MTEISKLISSGRMEEEAKVENAFWTEPAARNVMHA